MLTPAEEAGLAGLRPRQPGAARALSAARRRELAGLIERLRAGALEPARRLPARRRGGRRSASSLPRSRCCPTSSPTSTASRSPCSARSSACPSLYLQDFTVREILRLPDAEEPGFASAGARASEAHNPVFGRLDAWSTSPARCGRSRCGSSSRISAASAGCTWSRRANGCSRTSSCRCCGRGRRARPRRGPGHARAAGPDAARPPGGDRRPARRSASSSPSTPATGRTSRTAGALLRDRYGLTRDARRPVRAGPEGRRRVATRRSGWTWPTGTTACSTCWSSRPRASTSSRCGVLLRENRMVSSIAAELDQKSLLGGADRSAALPGVLHRRGAAASSAGTSSGPAC